MDDLSPAYLQDLPPNAFAGHVYNTDVGIWVMQPGQLLQIMLPHHSIPCLMKSFKCLNIEREVLNSENFRVPKSDLPKPRKIQRTVQLLATDAHVVGTLGFGFMAPNALMR